MSQTLPLLCVGVDNIHYVDTQPMAEHYFQNLLNTATVVSLDVEHDPQGPNSAVDIISVDAPESPQVTVIHVSRFAPQTPAVDVLPSLLAVMGNQNIVKVGIGLPGDISRISKKFGFPEARNLVDIGYMARATHPAIWHGQRFSDSPSLQRVVQLFLSEHLAKNPVLQQGDWSTTLDSTQLEYSAADARAALRVYQILVSTAHQAASTEVARQSYTFDLCGGSPHYQRQVPDEGGQLRLVRWSPFNPEYDEVNGIVHIRKGKAARNAEKVAGNGI